MSNDGKRLARSVRFQSGSCVAHCLHLGPFHVFAGMRTFPFDAADPTKAAARPGGQIFIPEHEEQHLG
jgi:hypothetical protein